MGELAKKHFKQRRLTMPKNFGRSGKPGNMRGQPGMVKIAMRDPMAHLKLQKKKK
jgi:hypothetical protein